VSGDAYDSAQENASKVLEQLRDTLSRIVNLPPMSMEELQRLSQETQQTQDRSGRRRGERTSGSPGMSQKEGVARSPGGVGKRSETDRSPGVSGDARSPSSREEKGDEGQVEEGASPRRKAMSMLASGLLMIINNTKAAITGLATAVAHPVQSTCACWFGLLCA
jgi:hypothetical protein